MKTIGIIAEYNPFHNGHAYQIKKIREQTNADFCIVAMSGNFVQRGAPAIVDKYARTRMALSCGADLVVELPVLWATASAEDFAMAGVSLFDKMGCVDGLCFGAETDDLPLLSAIAEVLVQEPREYQDALSFYLKKGLNFPRARANALQDYFGQVSASSTRNQDANMPKDIFSENILTEILGSPNNILALEYLKALRRRNSSITPYLIKREGAGYHQTSLSKVDDAFGFDYKDTLQGMPCASSTAIRNALLPAMSKIPMSDSKKFGTQKDINCETITGDNLTELASAMPSEALSVLTEYCCTKPLICTNDFSALLSYRLLLESQKGVAHFFDSNADISNRVYKNRYHFLSFEQFCELNKSKDITYTRMSRILLHVLLGLTKEDATQGKNLDYIPYFRLLGFRRSSAAALSAIKKASSDVPMISKLADAKTLLDGPALRMLEQDIFASELYEQILSHKQNREHIKGSPMPSEFTQEIVLV